MGNGQSICTQCQLLTFDTLLAGFSPHANFAGLLSSAANCQICEVMASALLNQPSDNWWPDEQPRADDVVRARLVRGAQELNKFPERLEMTVLRSEEEIREVLDHDQYCKQPEIRLVKHAIVCVDPKYALASELKIRPIRDRAECLENVELLGSWLRDCLETHEECNNFQAQDQLAPLLPDRVIDIGPSDGSEEPKLWQPKSVHGLWVALSYCWGKTPFLKLLEENLAEFEHGIPLNTMPQTFQDAIWLTRQIGLRYLWIDALCIIQDSSSDWRVQSAQMPSIYHGAHLTIASSTNQSPFEGLFGKRDDYFTHRYPVHLNLGEEGMLQFTTRREYHSAAGYSLKDPHVKDHLVDRGWCLQEKVLSRRFLSFHPTEMSFTCCRQILLESYYEQDSKWQLKQRGPFGADMARFQDGDGAWRNDFFMIVDRASTDGIFPNKNRDLVMQVRQQEQDEGRMIFHANVTPELTNMHKLKERWYDILTDYTYRQLTKERDKLIAVSGIARYILANSKISGDDYHAGIFKSMLPHSLMWKIPKQRKSQEEWMGKRPAAYRAPSWSWASMEGGLDFERCWKYVNEVATCEVVSVESDHPVGGNDSCGDVTGGRIVIRGKSRLAMIQIDSDHLVHADSATMGGSMGVGIVHLDDRLMGEDRVVVCLELWKCQGLLLGEMEDGQFERLGIYSMSMLVPFFLAEEVLMIIRQMTSTVLEMKIHLLNSA